MTCRASCKPALEYSPLLRITHGQREHHRRYCQWEAYQNTHAALGAVGAARKVISRNESVNRQQLTFLRQGLHGHWRHFHPQSGSRSLAQQRSWMSTSRKPSTPSRARKCKPRTDHLSHPHRCPFAPPITTGRTLLPAAEGRYRS